MDIDSALAKVGGYKRWNIAIYLVIATSLNTPLCWQGLSIIFVGWQPHHVCVGSESWNDKTNKTYLDIINTTHLWSNLSETNQSYSNVERRCHLEINDSRTGNVVVENCMKWNYKNDGYYTITEQWDLVCDQNYMAELSQALYQVGSLIGDLFSFVVDRYGRKKMYVITHFLICVIGVSNALSVSYPMFAFTKTIIGLFSVINFTAGSTLIMELFDAKRRTLPVIMIQCFWSLCYTLLFLLAYFIKHWTCLQLAISLISLMLVVLTMLSPESPVWLASKGQIDRADAVLRKIAKWNNVKLDPNLVLLSKVPTPLEKMSDVYNSHESENKSTILGATKIEEYLLEDNSIKISERSVRKSERSKYKHLLDSVILKFIAISSLFWFSTCFVFHGLILSTPSLKGNRFVNFFLMGLSEWPATFLACFFSNRIGRRLTSMVSMFLSGCFVTVILFIPKHIDSFTSLNLALIIISKGFISITFAIIILYTKELFPSNIRATCCGIFQIWGRVGALLAPIVVYLMKTDMFWLPNILFGVVSITVSFLLLLLPETNNQHLPETLEDCHKLNARKFCSCNDRK